MAEIVAPDTSNLQIATLLRIKYEGPLLQETPERRVNHISSHCYHKSPVVFVVIDHQCARF